MRLWTLHPQYLDPRGLVALWREALLAQAVLEGQTAGYTRHPQLLRFRMAPDPAAAIACYLRAVRVEAGRRGYRFDAAKIGTAREAPTIAVPRGQLAYERDHLAVKLRVRAPAWLAALPGAPQTEAHPLFHIIPGPVAGWETLRRKGDGNDEGKNPCHT